MRAARPPLAAARWQSRRHMALLWQAPGSGLVRTGNGSCRLCAARSSRRQQAGGLTPTAPCWACGWLRSCRRSSSSISRAGGGARTAGAAMMTTSPPRSQTRRRSMSARCCLPRRSRAPSSCTGSAQHSSSCRRSRALAWLLQQQRAMAVPRVHRRRQVVGRRATPLAMAPSRSRRPLPGGLAGEPSGCLDACHLCVPAMVLLAACFRNKHAVLLHAPSPVCVPQGQTQHAAVAGQGQIAQAARGSRL
jgi:hypothetical protein